MGKKKINEMNKVEEPKTIWWYFSDDNYLGLKVVTILIVFMFSLWYFHTYLSVGVPGLP